MENNRHKNGVQSEFSLGSSGEGYVHLPSGELNMSATDIVMENATIPMAISRSYVSGRELSDSLNLPESMLGNEWKMNLEQYLTKENNNDSTSQSLTSANYHLYDSSNVKHNFTTKYYYEEYDEKVFIDNLELISIDVYGSLSYDKVVDGKIKKYDIIEETESCTGLKIMVAKEHFKGIADYEQRSDDIANVEEQVKAYKDRLYQLKLSAELNNKMLNHASGMSVEGYDGINVDGIITNDIYYKNHKAMQANLNKMEQANLDFIARIKHNKEIIKNANSDLETILKNKPYIYSYGELVTKAEAALSAIPYDMDKYREAVYVQDIYAWEFGARNKVDNAILTKNGTMQFNETLSANAREIELKDFIKTYTATTGDLAVRSNTKQLSESNQKLDFLKQDLELSLQIKRMQNDGKSIQKEIIDINEKLSKLVKQLVLLKSSYPTHIIIDGDTMYGYAQKFSMDISYETIQVNTDVNNLVDVHVSVDYSTPYYRLVAIFDNSENQLAIIYNGDRISAVIDNKNNTMSFVYGEKYLHKITVSSVDSVEYNYLAASLSTVSNKYGNTSYTYTTSRGAEDPAITDSKTLQITTPNQAGRLINLDPVTDKVMSIVDVSQHDDSISLCNCMVADVTNVCSLPLMLSGTVTNDQTLNQFNYDSELAVRVSNINTITAYSFDNQHRVLAELVSDSTSTMIQSTTREYIDLADMLITEMTDNQLHHYNRGIRKINSTLVSHVDYTDITLLETKTTIEYLDENDRVIIIDNTSDKVKESFNYNNKGDLSTKTLNLYGAKNRTYTQTYDYTSGGKIEKVRNYDGMIDEYAYNDKGQQTCHYQYSRLSPAVRFCEEVEYDDLGRLLREFTADGKSSTEYKYKGTSGAIEKTIAPNGQPHTSAEDFIGGYELQLSTSLDGDEVSNTFNYKHGNLDSVAHNGFAYRYGYDMHDRLISIDIYCNGIYSSYWKCSYSELQYITDGKHAGKSSQIYTVTNANAEVYYITTIGGVIDSIHYSDKTNTAKVLLKQYCYTSHMLQSVTDYAGSETVTTTLTRDNFGDVTREASTDYTTTITRDSDRNITELSIKLKVDNGTTTNTKFTYTDEVEPKLSKLQIGDNITQSLKYDNLSRVSEIKNNIATKKYSYLTNGDRTTNLINVERHEISAQNSVSTNRYTYDESGNITQVIENNIPTIRYAYDKLSRLIREDNKNIAKSFVFIYDIGGNITDKYEVAYTLDDIDLSTAAHIPYTYVIDGWRDQLLSYKDETFAYDNIGNPTTYRGKKLNWSHGRKLNAIENVDNNNNNNNLAFTYNADGIRRTKTYNGITTTFITADTKILAEKRTTGADKDLVEKDFIEYHYGADGILGFTHETTSKEIIDGIEKDVKKSTQYIYRKNIQGDITHIYDTLGNLHATYTYDAWGNHKVYDNNGVDITANMLYNNDINASDSEEVKSNKLDELAKRSHIGNINPIRYRGYYYDVESNLYYLNTRYYDPAIGRFINADEITILDETRSQIHGLNLYMYCGNNPVGMIDPSGRLPEWLKWLSVGLAVIGAVLVVGAITVLTAGVGTATLMGSIAVGASYGILIGAGVGVTSGAIIGGVTTGTWEGVLVGAGIGLGAGAIIGGIIGGASGASSWYSARALEFTHVGTSNKVGLGSRGQYVEKASQNKATYFNTSDARWSQVQDMTGVGRKGMTKINRKFLKQQIRQGKTFHFSNMPTGDGYLAKELAYLIAKKIPWFMF